MIYTSKRVAGSSIVKWTFQDNAGGVHFAVCQLMSVIKPIPRQNLRGDPSTLYPSEIRKILVLKWSSLALNTSGTTLSHR